MISVTTFRGKTVAVLGLGGSGLATCRALAAGGATVFGWDDTAASREAAAKAGVTVVDLATADWSHFAALVLAPGVPLTHPKPHWTVEKARAASVEVIGDIELFFRERAAHCPEAPVIAITGTNGKSTTTALIAHILRAAGFDVQMGGNIGVPILALEPGPSLAPSDARPQPTRGDRIYVVEMSSFQIDLTTDAYLKPTVGVLLNITPDHLDRHGPADDPDTALANYAAIKERLVKSAETVVIGVDGSMSRAIYSRRSATTGVNWEAISALGEDADWQAHDGNLFDTRSSAPPGRKFASLAGASTLRGSHNAQNALAASVAYKCIARSSRIPVGVDARDVNDQIQTALRSFPGLPHRMEEVGRIGHTAFINDSKATNADSTDKALASWERDIFWILGGKAKEGGIRPLAAWFPRIAKAYLIGQASDDFAATLEGNVPFERCGTLDVAVARAATDAAHCQGPEPVVLLSPACASYDQFKSFEHRGNAFRDLVAALPGAAMKPRVA